MNKREFAETIAKEIEKRMPEHEVRVTEVPKLNGIVHTSLAIKECGKTVAPTICIDWMFEKGMNIDACVESAIIQYKDAVKKDVPKLDFSWENVKNKIEPMLINRENNAEILKQSPHYVMGDLALIFAVRVENAEMHGSVRISNDLLKGIGVGLDDLLSASEQPIRECRAVNMSQMLVAVRMGDDFDFEHICSKSDEKVMCLTNKSKVFGAVGLLNAEHIKEIADRNGRDLYIIPSSVHEVLIINDDEVDAGDLREMVSEVNATEVAAEERLSNNIYKYERSSCKLFAILENGELTECVLKEGE